MATRNLTPTLVKLGLFTAVALAVSVLVLGTLQDGTPGASHGYRLEFSEVSNVRPGDPVRVAGVKVGQVTGVDLVDDHAVLTVEVAESEELSTATHAAIRFENLLGQRYVALLEGPAEERASAEPLDAGDTIPMSMTTPALDLTVVFNGFRPLFEALRPDQVNQLAEQIISTLQGEGGTIASLLRSTASLTGRLADRDEIFGQVIDNLSLVVDSAAEHRGEFVRLVAGLNRIAGRLAADSDEIDTMITSVSELSRATRGLLDDAGPAATRDIARLQRLAALWVDHRGELEDALRDYPDLLDAVTRSMGYGSWINVYMCELTLQVAPVPPVPVGVPGQESDRC